MNRISRRTILKTAAAAAATGAVPFPAYAQGEPIRLGILTPLTGEGGNDGFPTEALRHIADLVAGIASNGPRRVGSNRGRGAVEYDDD